MAYVKIILNVKQSVFEFLEEEAKKQDISVTEAVANALGYYVCLLERKRKRTMPKTTLLLDDGSGKLIYLDKKEVL